MQDALRAAFRTTEYRFATPDGELLLKVDEPNPALGALLRRFGASSMAVVTAFNPRALRQEDTANHAAQARLVGVVTGRGYSFIAGRNEDPGGTWPVEESLLIMDISLPAASELAASFDQLAFLWTDAGSDTARLIEIPLRACAG